MPTFRMKWTKAEDTMSDRYRIEICDQTYEMVCPLPDQYHSRSYVVGRSGQIVVADNPTATEDKFIDWLRDAGKQQRQAANTLLEFAYAIPDKEKTIPPMQLNWIVSPYFQANQTRTVSAGGFGGCFSLDSTAVYIDFTHDNDQEACIKVDIVDGDYASACLKAEENFILWMRNAKDSFQFLLDSIPR